ncbi:thiol reductant ABC exporter subunit CydD [Salinibius halmophilus]|uniref:thiol reductant ABC exporter subunit CydD n=1 Tax=Salinibius halmophilus TaxID=1853216 RepID=UPI001314EA28|nr:thiol reductant ABC exporter subunit CydD [Salinibius halmophilus]
MAKRSVTPAAAWLKQQTRSIRLPLMIATAAGVVAALLFVWQAKYLADLISGLALGEAVSLSVIPLIVGLMAARLLLLWVKDVLGVQASLTVRKRVRQALLTKLAELGPNRSRFGSDGALSTAVFEQVDALDGYLARYIPQQILVLVIPLIILVAVWPISKLAVLIFVGTAPLVPFFMIIVGKGASSASRKQFKAMAIMGGQFLDLMRGLPTLKLLGRTALGRDRLDQSAEQYRAKTMSVLRLAFLSTAVLELFASLSIALIAVFLGIGLLEQLPWAKGEVPVPLASAMFILLLAPEFYQPLRQLGTDYHARAHALGAAETLQPILAATTVQNNGSLAAPQTAATIEFNQLSWQPNGRDVLKQVSLTVSAGERIALIGESGAGKSSMLHMLLGFTEPTSGNVMIAGKTLTDYDLSSWRQQLVWLAQRPEWFSGTIADNLRIGNPSARDDDLWQALQQAGALPFVRQLPDGLASRIGEGGIGLSGGQLQRIALARAVLSNASTWLLDEPGAHLDRATAAELRQQLATASAGKTLIMATHDLADLDWVDRIIRVRNGEIEEVSRG